MTQAVLAVVPANKGFQMFLTTLFTLKGDFSMVK
jgi:hypothetical protein